MRLTVSSQFTFQKSEQRPFIPTYLRRIIGLTACTVAFLTGRFLLGLLDIVHPVVPSLSGFALVVGYESSALWMGEFILIPLITMTADKIVRHVHNMRHRHLAKRIDSTSSFLSGSDAFLLIITRLWLPLGQSAFF
jgi:hypothetical protein